MLSKRFLVLFFVVSFLFHCEDSKAIEPQDCYVSASVSGTTFGLPTVSYFLDKPTKSIASLLVCGAVSFAAYYWYQYKMSQGYKYIEAQIKNEYQKQWNAQWQKEMDNFQAKQAETQDMTKSNVRIFMPGDILESFDDVAGMEDAKEDLEDIILYLDDPESFDEIGAKIPNGILLSGPPGVGKTLLARGLAGEADCPFLYISASEFSEMYVGRGAARVRNLFQVAREHAPCILFVDEIDAVAYKRGSSGGSSGDAEHAQTLNQLLAEMDGFEQGEDAVVVIAATNRAESLDSAILRPGRFDKTINIELPSIIDRRKIIDICLEKVKHDKDIDVDLIARGTVGFSGAELSQLINEAALVALRSGEEVVAMKHIDESRDIILMGGKERSNSMELTKEDLWKTAVHEAGHALMHVYEKDSTPLYKVTIRPRGGALGITYGMHERDKHSISKENMIARICVCLGGSLAEELSYEGRGAGISSDLVQARQVAKRMVMIFGMSEGFKDISFSEYIGREYALPPEISEMLHKEIARIIHECREHTKQVLSAHIKELHEVANQLMIKGTLFGSEVYKICGEEKPSLEYRFVDVP